MRKSWYLVIGVCLWSSCSKTTEERVYTAEEAKRTLDSVRVVQAAAIQKESEKTLAMRKDIELKPMIDSLKKKQAQK